MAHSRSSIEMKPLPVDSPVPSGGNRPSVTLCFYFVIDADSIGALRVLIRASLEEPRWERCLKPVFIRTTFTFAAVCRRALINSDVSQSAAPLQLRWD